MRSFFSRFLDVMRALRGCQPIEDAWMRLLILPPPPSPPIALCMPLMYIEICRSIFNINTSETHFLFKMKLPCDFFVSLLIFGEFDFHYEDKVILEQECDVRHPIVFKISRKGKKDRARASKGVNTKNGNHIQLEKNE